MKSNYEELANKAIHGDQNALNTLIEDSYGDFYYFALKTVKNPDVAADVTQDSVLRMMTSIGSLRAPAAFPVWARTIVYHFCTKHFAQNRELTVEEDENGETVFDRLPDEDQSNLPAQALEDNEFKQTILDLLSTLPGEQRATMLLYYYERFSVGEIAEIAGVSEGTVKSRLSRGREAVKNKVEAYEKRTGVRLHSAAFIPMLLASLYKNDFALTPKIAFTLASTGAAGAAGAAGTISAVGTAGTAATTVTAAGTGITLLAKIASIAAAVAILGAGTFGALKLVKGNNSTPSDESVVEINAASNELIYELNEDGNGYEVIHDFDYDYLSGNLIIPSTYNGKPVTSIGFCAFQGCTGLTSVVIPNSVTSIGDCAFTCCTGLTSVTIPNSVTSIGDCAFEGCTGLTSVVIPDSVTFIGERAFDGCTGLTSVTIPDSVTSIGSDTFYKCTKLTSITIPNSVTSIGESAFECCESLTSVTIPDSMTVIGAGTFRDCHGLTSVTIPDSVTTIGNSAFRDCHGLTSVTIPDGVTSIGEDAFYKCTGLTSMTVSSGNKIYHSAGNCIIETASKTLLAGCKTSVIPADGSITSIGEMAFSNCTGLTSVTIPDSVTSIGKSAFSWCTGLTSITIPDSVTSIGYYAFGSCTGLTSMTVASGNKIYHSAGNCIIETASKMLVAGCKTSVIPTDGSITSIGERAFSNCAGLTSVTIPDSVTSIGYYAFYNCTRLTSVTIPDSVTSIGDNAFYNCTGLTSVTIPDSVTSIGSGAFFKCTGLTSVTIPDSVTSIGDCAFECCESLTSVTIPDSVTEIGDSAFRDCTGLTSIVIPDSVTEIGANAFCGCTGLTTVYYTGSAAEWAQISIWTSTKLDPILNAEIVYNYAG